MDIWVVGTSNYLFYEFLKLRQIFQKNKAVTGKTALFVIVHFVVAILVIFHWLPHKNISISEKSGYFENP